jgi:hypothetical protein
MCCTLMHNKSSCGPENQSGISTNNFRSIYIDKSVVTLPLFMPEVCQISLLSAVVVRLIDRFAGMVGLYLDLFLLDCSNIHVQQ